MANAWQLHGNRVAFAWQLKLAALAAKAARQGRQGKAEKGEKAGKADMTGSGKVWKDVPMILWHRIHPRPSWACIKTSGFYASDPSDASTPGMH